MNKYILADMVTEKLKREIGMVPKPFPEELKITEAEFVPGGKVRSEHSLYQAEKLKKISISKHSLGEGAGTVVIIAAEDEYDLPFVVVDIAFDFGKKGKIFGEFEAKPLVWDEESIRKYTDPFRKWREEIGKLPSEPSGFGESGEFLKTHHSQIHYLHFIPEEYTDKVLNLADQFLDIFVSIYRKAEPVEDVERRRKMDAFRSEYNRCTLDEDPQGRALRDGWGREKAQLFFEHFNNM